MNQVLVLDADDERRKKLQLLLAGVGLTVSSVAQTDDAKRELAQHSFDAMFCDLDLLSTNSVPDGEAQPPDGPLIIVTTDRPQRDEKAALIRRAAFDCLVHPLDATDVALALGRAERYQELRRSHASRPVADAAGPANTAQADPPQEVTASPAMLAGMVGVSPSMQALFRTIEKVAQHKANVLIYGESGTGKELVARALHTQGPRAAKPFVAINCGAIPPNLLESELFGHKRGAFTDAVRDKVGLFEEAHTGTLFLDEIGELPLGLQVKLLRAIQEEEIRRVGDSQPIQIDVRIVAATLKDLQAEVRGGTFREDLYYRLNVLPLDLPPLRERAECIPSLVHHFVERYKAKHASAGMIVDRVSSEALDLLVRYGWPGNIRELENTIERAMVLCEGEVIETALLQDKLRGAISSDRAGPAVPADELSIKKTTRMVEERLIRRALGETGGNRTSAAKLLEISHRALLYKIKEYGL